MERSPHGPSDALAQTPWRRLALALALALGVHAVAVLGAEPLRAGLRRVRVALGLAALEDKPPQPRDDDWIRIVFELPKPPSQTAVPPRIPPAPPPPRVAAKPLPMKLRPLRKPRLASLARPPSALLRPPIPVPAEPQAPQQPGQPPPAARKWLGMRPAVSTSGRAPGRRPLDLVYRPAPGALGALPRDRGRLRVAGRNPAPQVDARPRVAPKARGWRPLPEHLRVKRTGPPARFHLDGKGRPVYAGVKLKWLGRGRWRYPGPKGTFIATVHTDGKVTFKDRPSFALDGVKGSPPMRMPGDSQARAFSGIVVGVGFTFDVTDAIMRRLGQDPYSAEKRRFARLTQQWRDKLRAGFHRRIRAEALARFGPQAGLCSKYRALDAAGQGRTRRWLFTRWNETREDARGKPLRSAILGAIQRCGVRYPPAELARLNAARRGRLRFRP